MKIVTATIVVIEEVADDVEICTTEELQSFISKEGLDIFPGDAKIILTNLKVTPL